MLAAGDVTIELWDVGTERLRQTLQGHKNAVWSVAWAPDGQTLASGGGDRIVRLWDVETGRLRQTLEGHQGIVRSVAWAPDGQTLASGGVDRIVRLWDVETGHLRQTLEGLQRLSFEGTSVWSIAWAPDGQTLASGADDRTIRLWDVETGRLRQTLEGHQGTVRSVAWAPDGQTLASGADDRTIRLWDVETGRLRQTLEGHHDTVWSVAWAPNGHILASADEGGQVLVWQCDTWEIMQDFGKPGSTYITRDLSFHATTSLLTTLGNKAYIRSWEVNTQELLRAAPIVASVRYTSAKIVLVGESNVGKSCLALRLAQDRFEAQETTHGMRLWLLAPEQLDVEEAAPPGEKRDIILWDMGGQDEYRLVHQLFFHDTTLALLLLDPTRGRTAFEEVEGWNLLLKKQLHGRKAVQLLVGTKLDEESAVIDRSGLDALVATCKCQGYYPTSAKTGRGILELRAALAAALDWATLAKTSRPVLFQRVRDAIEQRQQCGEVVVLYTELEAQIRQADPEQFNSISVQSVVEQLALQGVITDTRLASGARALILQISEVERYAGALIFAARNNPRGVPALEERLVMSASMSFPGIKEADRLHLFQERIVLECVVELLLDHGICLRHEGLLIFPTLFRATESGDGTLIPHTISLYYDFSGAIDNIYSSLVVRLALSERFGRIRLWEDRAEFEHLGKGVCGLRKVGHRSGLAHLDLFFSTDTGDEIRDLFTVFIEEHLRHEGVSITEVLEITCGCGYRFEEALLRERLTIGRADVLCPRCETRNRISEGAKKARTGSPKVEQALLALKTVIDRRKQQAIEATKRVFREASQCPPTVEPIRILHLSDLHMGPDDDPIAALQPLVRDLEDCHGGLGFDQLDYLVVSGDLTNRATAEEFEQARKLISGLIERFRLTAERCIIVPGNHDLSWDQQVYTWKPQRMVDLKILQEGSYYSQGSGFLIRDEQHYPTRFENFSKFYHALIQQQYPLQAEAQGLVFLFDDTRLQFLTLNSAWEIDEFFSERSSIHSGALTRGLAAADTQVRKAKEEGRLDKNATVLRLAVWHHPVTGNEKIVADAFLDLLRQAEIRLCLHGHVHEDRADVVRYLDPVRKVYIAGAGSLGAPAYARPESVPRLYNVLEITRDLRNIRVHTRCLRKIGGAWEGWAVWPGLSPTDRRTYYNVELQGL